MNGYTPQQASCPHCGIQRTVRLGYTGTSLCMNCHARWGGTLPAPHPPADAVLDREDAFPFTPSELERLEIYRRAVAAGFYAD